jgi:hypothetical protein
MSSSPDPELLMQLFDFSITDLAANRDGKITAYQVDLLRQNLSDDWFALGCLPVASLMCFLCFMPLTLSDPQNADPLAIPIVIGGGLLLTFITVGICLYAIRRSTAELKNPRVKSIRGQIHVYMKDDGGKGRVHTLRVEHIELSIKPSQYAGLSQRIHNANKQKNYKVYYTEKTKTVLSIEALS